MTRSKLKKPPLRYIVYLLLLTMLVTNISLARYKTTIAGSGSVSVARPVVTLIAGQPTLNGSNISLNSALQGLKPGDTLIYPFSVRNYDNENKLTQVKMQYRVNVQLEPPAANLPFEYNLTCNQLVYNNESRIFGFSAPTKDEFILTITWPAAKIEEAYMGKNQEVKIKLESEQLNN